MQMPNRSARSHMIGPADLTSSQHVAVKLFGQDPLRRHDGVRSPTWMVCL